MWRPRLPRRNPDAFLAAGLGVGLPAVCLIIGGAPIVSTALAAVAIAAVLMMVH
jgi:hypothetical protein